MPENAQPQVQLPALDATQTASFLVEEWKSTQQSAELFDDLGLRMRTFGIGGVFLIAGYGVQTIKDDKILSIWSLSVHSSALIVLISLIVLAAVYFFDRYYYFALLIGAVVYGQELERIIRGQREVINAERLTQMFDEPLPGEKGRPKGSIKGPTRIWGKTCFISYYVSKVHPGLHRNLHFVYGLLAITLIVTFIVLNFSTGPAPGLSELPNH